MQGLAHPDGEIATARASAKLNIPMGLSSYSSNSSKKLEDVAAQATESPFVMQLSLLKNKDTMIKLLKRTEGTPSPIA